jgi:ribosomal protein L34
MIHWRLTDFGPLGQTMLEKLKQHGFRARKEGG